LSSTTTFLQPEEVITNFIEPLLCSADFYNVMVEEFADAERAISEIRCFFSPTENDAIVAALTTASTSSSPVVDLYFSAEAAAGSPTFDEWTVDSIYPPTFSDIFRVRV